MKPPKVGDVFYGVRKERTVHIYSVLVTKVTDDAFFASWNGNKAAKYKAIPTSWKRRKPYLVRTALGYGLAKPHERSDQNLIVRDRGLFFLIEKKGGHQ